MESDNNIAWGSIVDAVHNHYDAATELEIFVLSMTCRTFWIGRPRKWKSKLPFIVQAGIQNYENLVKYMNIYNMPLLIGAIRSANLYVGRGHSVSLLKSAVSEVGLPSMPDRIINCAKYGFVNDMLRYLDGRETYIAAAYEAAISSERMEIINAILSKYPGSNGWLRSFLFKRGLDHVAQKINLP